jgi:putative redox protein
MKAKVAWRGNLSFEGTADTGFAVPLGAAPEVGGDNDGFRPMELFLNGLAGCTAMDVISILRKKKQDVTAFEVQVDADRANDHPKVFTRIHLHFIITGRNIDPGAVERAIELSATRYCPAQAMLGQIVPITIQSTIKETA